jgi:hypothetical protein
MKQLYFASSYMSRPGFSGKEDGFGTFATRTIQAYSFTRSTYDGDSGL